MRRDIPAIISLLLVIGCAKPAQPLPVEDEPEPVKLKYCSTENRITDDMLFSSVCAGTTSSVSQGFDWYEPDDMMFFTQVSSNYKNTVGWTKRVAKVMSTATCRYKMVLKYFSHGNNFWIDKKGENYYIWIANYGSRDPSDFKYRSAQILSRVKLVNGATVLNTDATDNYYFGTHNIHASLDRDNDLLAILGDNKQVKIYKFSEVLTAPVKDITLPYAITTGGDKASAGSETGDPEWTGKPKVTAHDCTKLTPRYTFTFNYSQAGFNRGWQTFCIKDGKAWFFNFDKSTSDSDNGIYDSVIDIISYNGTVLKKGIYQQFCRDYDNMERLGFTDKTVHYFENEGIMIRDGVLYLMYTAKNKNGIRRPVVMRFSMDDPAFK